MVYNFLRLLVRLFIRIVFRWEFSGVENIPESGPTLIASNHLSFWDPPVIGCAMRRPIHFMAKEELFRIPIFGWLITQLQAFPVKRGAADRGALRNAISLLEQGEAVGLFPEGTRSKTGRLGKPEPGLALIAAKSRAVIVPAAVLGTNKVFQKGNFFPKFRVKFGKPIIIEAGITNRETLDKISERIMSEIAVLLGEEENYG